MTPMGQALLLSVPLEGASTTEERDGLKTLAAPRGHDLDEDVLVAEQYDVPVVGP